MAAVARGDSLGTELTYQAPAGGLGELTLGAQIEGDLRNFQQNYTVYPARTYLPGIDHPDVRGAFFAQQEWRVSSALTAYGGVRLDCTRAFGCSLSPRLALIYRPSEKTAYKLVYGRPFRNPSAFENYFTDYGKSFVASGGLQPETAEAMEASAERKLGKGLSAILNLYRYQINRMIEADIPPDGPAQYRNSGYGRSRGVELELSEKAGRWLEAGVSYSYQSAFNTSDRRTPGRTTFPSIWRRRGPRFHSGATVSNSPRGFSS